MTQSLPLEGLRVLDFSRHLPGPWCGQMLSDLGAEVIKIEHKGIGDPSRFNPPRYRRDSVYFHAVNSGKRSIMMDLSKPEAAEVARRLLATADIVVESFRTGGADALGVGYEGARAQNPGVVYCSISGFGRTGTHARSPGHDLAIQSLTGLLDMAHEPGKAVPNPPFHAADYAGGAMAVVGILAALQRRNRTGEGCYIDLSMYDSLMGMLEIALAGAMGRLAGAPDQRTLDVWGANPRYRTYPTGDGKAVTVCLLEAKLWAEFCRIIGRPELVHRDETLADRLTAHADRSELYREAVAAYCLSKSRDEIVAEMAAHHIPITPVLTPDEALASELARSRRIFEGPEADEVEGAIVHLNNPLQHAGLTRPRSRGPGAGEHTDDILSELGFASADIARLRAAGAV